MKLPQFTFVSLLLLISGGIALSTELRAQVPDEPIAIGFEPQFFVDDYLVDNHWPLRKGLKDGQMIRVFHAPVRHSPRPLITTDYRVHLKQVKPGVNQLERIEGSAPGMIGQHMVVQEGNKYRMWYDNNEMVQRSDRKGGWGWNQRVGYAESDDALTWRFPNVGAVEYKGSKANSLIGNERTHLTFLLSNIPEKDRRGYKYLFLSLAHHGKFNGITLVGSHDGQKWDWQNGKVLAKIHSDHFNSLFYDEKRQEYVMYLRAKERYLAHRHDLHVGDLGTGERAEIETYEGESRRIARISSRELWTDWLEKGRIQNIMLPDAQDVAEGFPRFYVISMARYAGIYWGYLARLSHDISAMDVELVTSRDGISFNRQVGRPRMLTGAAPGSWDDGLVFATPGWIEKGDQWLVYYRGDDEGHESPERNSAVGLLKLRKEGFVSMRGPKSGAVMATRELVWPGGDLYINTDAHEGEVKVMVTMGRREPIPGFGYTQSPAFRGDSVSQKITWQGRSLDELKGRTIRLEFLMHNADLYSFRAVR